MKISEDIVAFILKQGYSIVSTVNKKGKIHCTAKGIVGIEPEGRIFIIDLFRHSTYKNLKENKTISITVIEERSFRGYTFQGTAKIVAHNDMEDHILTKWEAAIIRRITNRMIKGVQRGVKSPGHFEAALPHKPKYLIEVDVESIIDLSPPNLSPDFANAKSSSRVG